jgi:hemerythrin-like domain-containing protein
MIISPTEDLMREHGLLNRLLLIYEVLIVNPQIDLFHAVAQLITHFVHNYHERLEEQYIFQMIQQRTTNVNLKTLIKILIKQHQIGQTLTQDILSSHSILLIQQRVKAFIHMYRAHESREDTEVFTEFNHLASQEESNHLGEIFEETEDTKFGEHGYENLLQSVIKLEKHLQIHKITTYEHISV